MPNKPFESNPNNREVAVAYQDGQVQLAPIANGEVRPDFGFIVSSEGAYQLYLDLHDHYHGED